MGCGQCTKYLQHHESSWNSSGKFFSYQPCGQTSCVEWLLETVKEKLVEKNIELEVENKKMKENLQFLRHKLDNEQNLGIRDGDVVIIVEGVTDQPLHAHKVILASRSPVFQKIFETDMQEKESGILRINDASVQVVRAVIKFCYNAEIEFTDEVTSEAVLEVSHKYDIDLLRKICVEDLTHTINRGNLPKRLKLARKFESIGLEAAASQFFKRNFDRVICHVLSEFC